MLVSAYLSTANVPVYAKEKKFPSALDLQIINESDFENMCSCHAGKILKLRITFNVSMPTEPGELPLIEIRLSPYVYTLRPKFFSLLMDKYPDAKSIKILEHVMRQLSHKEHFGENAFEKALKEAVYGIDIGPALFNDIILYNEKEKWMWLPKPEKYTWGKSAGNIPNSVLEIHTRLPRTDEQRKFTTQLQISKSDYFGRPEMKTHYSKKMINLYLRSDKSHFITFFPLKENYDTYHVHNQIWGFYNIANYDEEKATFHLLCYLDGKEIWGKRILKKKCNIFGGFAFKVHGESTMKLLRAKSGEETRVVCSKKLNILPFKK